jgi:CheY-like chemotaxis protein
MEASNKAERSTIVAATADLSRLSLTRGQSMKETSNVSANSLVLIVDHYRVGQRIALMQLNYFGLSGHVVTSCRQAMVALAKHHYSLVLIGWGRPDCDGAHCTKFVRRLEARRNKETTVVAVAAHARVGDKERCIAAGMDDLLCKPITMEDMQEMIRRHLKTA